MLPHDDGYESESERVTLRLQVKEEIWIQDRSKSNSPLLHLKDYTDKYHVMCRRSLPYSELYSEDIMEKISFGYGMYESIIFEGESCCC